MAEETPGNLGSIFGGWAAGRAAGNKRIDQSVDRLESQINKLTDAIETLTKTMGGKATNGGVPGGGTQTGATPNGGVGSHVGPSAGLLANLSAVFSGGASGAHAGDPTAATATGGSHAGGSSWNPFGTGGVGGGGGWHAPNGGGWVSQHGSTFAKGAAVAGVAAMGVYTKNHTSSSVTGQTLASMYAGGPDWNRAYQSGMTNDYVSHGTADHWATISAMGQQSGYLAGSSGWNQSMSRIKGMSASNPMISTAQGTSASMALSTPTSFNKMQGMGINPLGSNGLGDPRSVARQLLAKMHTQGVKTPNDVAALFGPAGNATITLNSFVSNGFLPAEAYQPVRSEMWNILMAQTHGMSYTSYARNESAANTSDAARDRLRNAGIAADTTVQAQHRREGGQRQSEAATIGGFTTAILASTSAINNMRAIVNKILGIGPVGEMVGLGQGAAAGGLGSVLGKLMSVGKLASVGMADGGVLPGYTPGRDTHRFFSSTGGTLDLSGGEGILIPQATKQLGGAPGIKAINDAAKRQSFAAGGVFQNPDQKTTMDGKSISAIAAAQIKLAEQIGHLNLTIMQGGFGGSHIAASGTSHNYPGVADISPGNIAVETLLRKVGFAAWARNIPGRSSAGSGAHVHAVSLLDPGDKGSAQVYGSWAHHGNGLSGYNNDPAGHPAWIPNLRQRLGAMNLKGLGGGGGSGGGSTIGAGGSTGATTQDSGGYTGGGGVSAGGGSGIGDFTEVGALALGGGGGGPGPMGMSSAPNGGSGGVGGSTGGIGGSVGSGGPGDVSIGEYNFKHGHAPMSDVDTIMSKVGVFGTSETRTNHGKLASYLRQHHWGYMQGTKSDTGLAYNASRYDVLRKGSKGITGTLWGGHRMSNSVPYMLLKDKQSGAKFWVMSAHTQVHGYKGGVRGQIMHSQYAQIRNLFGALEKTGAPVFLVGDLNNPNPMRDGIAPPGSHAAGKGIDWLITGGGDATRAGGGLLAGTGFHGRHPDGPSQMHSDHPFIWSDFNLPGIGGPSGGSGGTGRPPHGSNQDMVRAAMRKFGWNEWPSLYQLVMHESGFRNHAQNPSSSAYGMFQFLDSTWAGVGAHKTSDPWQQSLAGMQYIKNRYHDPKGAWNFWQKHNWYDSGAWNLKEDHDARVHKGEMILPSKIADIVRQELEAPGIGANLGRSRKGGGGMEVVFQSGAIQINFPSGDVTKPMARQSARWVVDAIMEDRRMRDLAER